MQGFVKVVDVEDEPPFRRTETAKIADMAIAARLNTNSGLRRRGKIRRHQGSRAAKERERRLPHQAVSDWQELGQSSSVRILQQFNWVGTISSTNPLGMGSSRHAFAQCFSRGHPFLDRRTEKLRVLAHNVFDLGSSYLHVFQFIALRMMSLAV